MLRTKIDDLITFLQERKRMSLEKISSEMNWKYKSLEKVLRALDKIGIVRVNYPINFIQKPWVELIQPPLVIEEVEAKGKLIEDRKSVV